MRLGAQPVRRRDTRHVSGNDDYEKTRRHRPDYSLVVFMTILLGIGAVTVFAISPGLTHGTGLSESYYSVKQLTAIALGIVAFLVAAAVPIGRWRTLALPLVVAAGVVAAAVRIVGDEVNGAYRWLQVGGFSFQAAELIKLALVVWLAGFLIDKKLKGQLDTLDTLKMVVGVIVAIAVVVAGLQSDLGSAAVMMAIIGFMTFVIGMPLQKLGYVLAGIAIIGGLAIVTSPYRRDRVATFLNPTADCQNEGYQACQALITVGSGGMFGVGLGQSVQAYGYLPEAQNDSIFAIVSEKFGFIGATIVVGLFFGLFKRMKQIAEQAPNEYSRLLVIGVLAWLSAQMMINVGAMLGLIPLKGITLPFVSYGGTSIIFVMVAVGIVFRISRYTELKTGEAYERREYGTQQRSVNQRVVSRPGKQRKWGSA